MPAKGKVKEIEVEEDLEFQQGEWTTERIGWIVMAVIVLLSLIGLFGDGPISHTTLTQDEGFQFTYERFTRNTSSSEIQVSFPESLLQEGQVSFWIDQKYLEGVQIDDISPEPEETVIEQGRTIYNFSVEQGEPPLEVKFDLTTERSGFRKGTIGWGNGQTRQFDQIVFP